jgi:hypothetical protein
MGSSYSITVQADNFNVAGSVSFITADPVNGVFDHANGQGRVQAADLVEAAGMPRVTDVDSCVDAVNGQGGLPGLDSDVF